MKDFKYKCIVTKKGMKMYYKKVKGKWKRINNDDGKKAEKGKRKYRERKNCIDMNEEKCKNIKRCIWEDNKCKKNIMAKSKSEKTSAYDIFYKNILKKDGRTWNPKFSLKNLEDKHYGNLEKGVEFFITEAKKLGETYEEDGKGYLRYVEKDKIIGQKKSKKTFGIGWGNRLFTEFKDNLDTSTISDIIVKSDNLTDARKKLEKKIQEKSNIKPKQPIIQTKKKPIINIPKPQDIIDKLILFKTRYKFQPESITKEIIKNFQEDVILPLNITFPQRQDEIIAGRQMDPMECFIEPLLSLKKGSWEINMIEKYTCCYKKPNHKKEFFTNEEFLNMIHISEKYNSLGNVQTLINTMMNESEEMTVDNIPERCNYAYYDCPNTLKEIIYTFGNVIFTYFKFTVEEKYDKVYKTLRDDFIKKPYKKINLNQSLYININNKRYFLKSMIIHVGDTAGGGHYYAFVRTDINKWYYCSDTNIKLMSSITEIQNNIDDKKYSRKVLSTIYEEDNQDNRWLGKKPIPLPNLGGTNVCWFNTGIQSLMALGQNFWGNYE